MHAAVRLENADMSRYVRPSQRCAASALALALAMIALTVTSAVAQAQRPELQGVYDLDAGASDDVEAIVTRGTEQMNFAIRGLARRLIAKANPRYEQIAISQDGVTARVQLDARAPILAPLNGDSVRWVREDGGTDTVACRWSYPSLELIFKADDGGRTHEYSLEPDGRTLKLYVELTSPRLPGPIDYTLVYRRR